MAIKAESLVGLFSNDTEFAVDLGRFFYGRQERLHEAKVSPEYDMAFKSVIEAFRRLESTLGDSFKEDLIELSDLHTNLEALGKDLEYKQGFRDGFQLLYQMLNGKEMVG